MKISLPIQITLLRIILSPIIVGCIVYQQWVWSALLFAFAVFTDYLDGFVARRYHQESRLGQLLDPIADKILIISLMYTIFLVKEQSYNEIWKAFFGWFFIAKELVFLGAAAVLYLRYDLFFKPTFFSRLVSVSEMVIIFEILTWRALCSMSIADWLYAPDKWYNILEVFLGVHVCLTMVLSLILLGQYAVSVILFLWKNNE